MATPISALQERAIKRKLSPPIYELLTSQEAGSNPMFRYEARVSSFEGIGTGRNKREAKQKAAEAVLAQLPKDDMAPLGAGAIEPAASVKFQRSFDGNHVGMLIQFCAKHKLNIPEYSEGEMGGPCHAPIFTAKCKLAEFEETALGSSKKLAKQKVARKMMERLQHSSLEDNKHPKRNALSEEEKKTYGEGLEKVYRKIQLSTSAFPNTLRINTIRSMHYELKAEFKVMPELLLKYMTEVDRETCNNVELLKQLAKEMGKVLTFDIFYSPEEKDTKFLEGWIGTVTLHASSQPIVAMGCGDSREECLEDGAHDMLDMLYDFLK